jgi:hypothetical protein
MKDTLEPFLSTYSGVRWSAPDDASIEGEFALAPPSLRYAKAKRRLSLRLTEISTLETWGGTPTCPGHRLAGRGELAEVLTVFELDGDLVRQFREVSEVTITPAPVVACTDNTRHSQVDPDHLENTGPPGVFFIDFEALQIHGEHPEPALKLNVTMELGEFNRVYSLVHERADDLKEVTLALDADLFGDGIDQEDTWGGWIPEYGMLRPADAPLVFAPARLERMEVRLERSRVLGSGQAASEQRGPDLLGGLDQPDDGSSIIARRLGWIIIILVVIIVILLSGGNRKEGITRVPRQIAEGPPSSGIQFGSAQTHTFKTAQDDPEETGPFAGKRYHMSDDTSGKGLVPSEKAGLVLRGRERHKLIRRAASDALVLMQTMVNQQEPILHRAGTKELFFPRISIKGKRFRFVEDGTETVLDTTKLDVVIVGMNPNLSKTFYAKAWDKDAEPAAPDCYSPDGIKPHPEAETPQNDMCAGCPHNAWGSKIGPQGMLLKACTDQKRLAVVSADDPEGPVYLLQVTPAALKGLNSYHQELFVRGIPVEVVKTKIGFDTDASFPKLKFGFGGFLDEDAYAAVEPLFGRDDVLAITGARQSNPTITKLDFCSNQLTELDLSSVPVLMELGCGNNQLTELDLSSVPALELLWCDNNQLTELDLSSVPALELLWCDNNQLTELDLSSVPALELLYCNNNQLTELDIRGCMHLESVTVDRWVIVHKRLDQTIEYPEDV